MDRRNLVEFHFFEPASVYLEPHVSVPSARLALAFIALFAGTIFVTGVAASLGALVVDKTEMRGTDQLFGMLFGGARRGDHSFTGYRAGLTPIPQDPWCAKPR